MSVDNEYEYEFLTEENEEKSENQVPINILQNIYNLENKIQDDLTMT